MAGRRRDEASGLKLVIFDCDGTIVDSQHMIVAAMETAFADAGLALPAREAVLSVVGLSLVPAVARLVAEPRDERLVHRVAESYKAAFGELRKDPAHAEPLYPGARETIAALAAAPDVLLAIATGKSRRGMAQLFEREGLGAYFHSVQTADTHPSKPHPSMIETAIAEAGGHPDLTVMIGDTTYDIEMARAAGVAALGVAWGYHAPDALVGAGAHHVAEVYAEVPDVVARLIGGR
jgi:phosphoglycolate phosphatase